MLDNSNSPSNSASNGVDGPLAPWSQPRAEASDLIDATAWSADYPSAEVASSNTVLTGLKRYKLLAIAAFVAIIAVAIPPVWLLMTPKYKATAVVRISPVLDPIVFNSEKTGTIPFYQSYLNTQVAIIRSPTLLERVLDRQEVRETDWYKQSAVKGNPSNDILGALTVQPRTGTELIDVSVLAEKARDAREIVNAIAAEYKSLNEEQSKASDTSLWETLTRERDRLQMVINGQLETKFNISSQLGTVAPEELRSQYSLQLSSLESERNRMARELKVLEWQLAGTAGAASSQPGDVAARVRKAYAQDPEWRALDQRLEQTRQDLLVAQQQLGESHPRIAELRLQVKHQEDVLAKKEAQLESEWTKAVELSTTMPEGLTSRMALEHVVAKRKRELELIEEDLKQQAAKVAQAGDIAREIAKFDEEIAQKRELKEAIRKRLEVLEMEGKAPARVKIAAYALEPSRPDKDRRLLLTAMILALASGVGIAAGYLRTILDRRIYEPGEVQQMYQVPFLGWLPKIGSAELPRELGGAAVVDNATDLGGLHGDQALMEHMRIVRTALLERVSRGHERVLLITSSLPCTGKTSVAVLLAKSLAMVGKRVLLVEGDLRKPALADRLGVDKRPGLAALLQARVDENAATLSTACPGFDVLLAGEIPDGFSPELLANGVFGACVQRWREAYDFVLLDSPPVLPVADAHILAAHADGTILVLRSSHDRRREAVEAYSRISAAGGRLLGTVLIGGGPGRGGNYGYEYKYSYGYMTPGPKSAG